LLWFTLQVTAKEETTKTETALWTFILWAIGLGVSYLLGKRSVTDAAANIVRPQARSATRRLITLGKGIRTMASVIEMHRGSADDFASANGGSVEL
jgi:hypothetical protein